MTPANTHPSNTSAGKARSANKAVVSAAPEVLASEVDASAEFEVSPSTDELSEPVYVGLIGTYNPLKSKFSLCSKEEWELIRSTVRVAVSRLDGFADRGLRPYLTAMTRLAVWAHREGLPLDPTVLLSHAVIEAHVASLSGSAGTFRSQLRRLALANGVGIEATGLGFDRPGYSQPYSFDEVEALLLFAMSHSNVNRRRQLTGFVLLGAGCGFSRGDLRGVCRNDLHHHSGLPYVRTANRCTPILDLVLPFFESYLTWCEDGPFIGVKSGGNVTDRMSAWVGERAGLPKLSGDRLRAFFIVEHLRRGTPLLELLAICGFTRLEALDSYLAFLPSPMTPCGSRESGPA